jgi:hypothetical protein
MPPFDRSSIIVAGDVSIDWLAWPLPAEGEATTTAANWRQREGTRMVARRGGALLLTDLLRQATSHTVIGPRVEQIELQSPDKYLHSMVDLEPRPDAPGRFRVARLRGFCGPDGCNPPQPSVDGPAERAALLILDDSGNGFRDTEAVWKRLVAQTRPRWLIVKMARPLAVGAMWDLARHGPPDDDGNPDPERLIVVLNAEDLRKEGIALSRRLSWERTAEDFVRELGSNGRLDTLVTCAHLIVRFDCDGVIYHRGRGGETPVLYFDATHAEGEFVDGMGCRMMGMTAAFTAGLAAALGEDERGSIGTAIKRGMTAAHRIAKAGFHADARGAPDYPHAHAMAPTPEREIMALGIPSGRIAAGERWSILHDRLGDAAIAARLVLTAGPKVALAQVPVAKFGDLETADRREIESYRAIGNLLRDYLAVSQTKPISIGVFGPPGAGKSFGVKQVAKHATPVGSKALPVLEFNLSQFTALADLIAAFHLVRDIALSGTVPLVFFDEFDCAFGVELGWLRYFLSPMQDGEFREAGHVHPLGPAIFVFAGGTRPSLAKFIEPMSRPGGDPARLQFAAVKGSDFASRLRGHIDILGPDPADVQDRTFPIRRAFLLRSMLQRREKLMKSGDRLIIDEGVLNAILTIPSYRHGVRSMEAILAMSALTGHRQFERADLPPTEQLESHVNAADFIARVKGERLDDDMREKLGRLLHEVYRKQRMAIAEDDAERAQLKSDSSMGDWDILEEHLRESNRQQADDIPRKLRLINCFMAPKIEGSVSLETFELHETARLAEAEHERFNAERLQKHWQLGDRNIAKRTSPFLVPWRDLAPKWRSLDESAVAAIPSVLAAIPSALAEVGWHVYRIADRDVG